MKKIKIADSSIKLVELTVVQNEDLDPRHDLFPNFDEVAFRVILSVKSGNIWKIEDVGESVCVDSLADWAAERGVVLTFDEFIMAYENASAGWKEEQCSTSAT